MHQQLEGEKQYKVNLPDNQVREWAKEIPDLT